MAMRERTFDFQSYLPFSDRMFARASGLKTIEHVHAHMVYRERLFLYSLVFAFAPRRCLEIGVAQGGSARIIHQALADLGQGTLVAVDPHPRLDFDWATISERATLLVGASPEVLPRAMAEAGGPFDFVFVDGDHSTAGVRADLVGLVDVTAPGAKILLHDAYYPPTAAGIHSVVRTHAAFADVGLVATTRNPGIELGTRETTYGGLRLLARRERGWDRLWRWGERWWDRCRGRAPG